MMNQQTRLLLLLATLFFMIISLNAQGNLTGHDGQIALHSLDDGFVTRTYDNRYQGSKGTPYLYPAWGRGTVELTDDQKIEQVSLHYDVYNDQLVANFGGDLRLIESKKVERFSMPDSNGKMVFFVKAGLVPELEGSKVEPENFVRILHKGQARLYAQYSKEFFKADFKGAYSSGREYDYFAETKTVFFLSVDGQTAEKVRKSTKKTSKAFGDEQKAMFEFLESRQVDLSTEKGVLMMVKHFEEIAG